MSKIALAENTKKLKHWSQAIRDLEREIQVLKDEIVPQNHACTKPTYGEGDETYYGHVKLLDNLIFNYNKISNEDGYWKIPDGIQEIIDEEHELPPQNKTIELANGRWNDIIYHNGLFIAVGSHGRIIKSKDGKKWDDVHFVGSTKSIRYTINGNTVTDGIETYNIINNRFTVNGIQYIISYNDSNGPVSVTDTANAYVIKNNQFVVGGHENDADFSLYAIEWCGNCFVAVGSYNMFTYSFDGAYWWGPIYVGASYDASYNGGIGRQIIASDLSENIFSSTDIWYGIAYDELTKTIHLCGSQGKVLCGKFVSDVSDKFVFGETYFNFNEYDINLYDIATICSNTNTYVVACGNDNYVLSAIYPQNTNTLNGFEWSRNQVEDRIYNTDDLSSSTTQVIQHVIDWKSISIQSINGESAFMLLGTNGIVMYSHTGEVNKWNLPTYNSNTDRFDINTMVGYNNLYVVAGEYQDKNNIIRYNENKIPEYTKIDEYGNEIELTLKTEIEEEIQNNTSGQSSMSAIKHTTEKFEFIIQNNGQSETVYPSWYGSCYGKEMFFLVGDNNAIICCQLSEDASNYAISLEFYKNYIKVLEDRILELEGRVINTNLEYKLLKGDEYQYGVESEDTSETFIYDESISYTTGSIMLYRTDGKVKLSFYSAPETIYKEMMIYLEAIKDTRLTISGADWENDLYMPDWGHGPKTVEDPNDPTKTITLKYHLTLKVIFVGGRVIVQIVDNDQLADNLVYEN